MSSMISRSQRILLTLMAVLYVITLAAFTYANWRVEAGHELWMVVANAIILSIPLVLVYGSIYVLLSAWNEHRQSGTVSPSLGKVIHWAPRAAAILIILFVGLFSLDVFEMEATPLEKVGAFLIHSLPSILMAVVLAFAWRRPGVGFGAFLLAGVAFLRFVIPGGNLGNFLLFSGPLLLIAGLFYADWRWQS